MNKRTPTMLFASLHRSTKASNAVNWTQFWIYVLCAIVGWLLLFTITASKTADEEQDIQSLRSQYLGLEGLNNLLRTPMETTSEVVYDLSSLGEDEASLFDTDELVGAQVVHESTKDLSDLVMEYFTLTVRDDVSAIEQTRRNDLHDSIREQTGKFIDAYVGEQDFVLTAVHYELYKNNELQNNIIKVNVDTSNPRYNADLLKFVEFSGRPTIEVVLPLYVANDPNNYYIRTVMFP